MARSIKIGTVNYGISSIADPVVRERVLRWQAANTDLFVGGTDAAQYNPATIQTFYLESAIFYCTNSIGNGLASLKKFCTDKGYDFESCLVHMRVDYKSKNPWASLDKFGFDENANGVIVDNAGVLTDKTTAAYANGVTFSTALYIGSDVPFDQVNFASQSGMVGAWEYSSPTGWSPLTFSGGFIPPADWTRTSVRGSWNKYFVRFVLAPGSPSATVGKITGDNWRTNTSTTNCRGWDSTSPTIINSGELAYNPTPPAHATAKFRQQARLTGAWAAHTLTANIGYKVGDVEVWAEYIGQQAISEAAANQNYRGVYYDDTWLNPQGSLTAPLPTGDYTDFSDYTSQTWDKTKVGTLRYARDLIHAKLPNYMVGTGGIEKSSTVVCDWVYGEMASLAITGSCFPMFADYSSRPTVCYDWASNTASNVRGTKVIFAIADHVDYKYYGGAIAFSERGNRGPMSVLASHLIGDNGNAYLHYWTYGGWRYGDTDDIYVFATPQTTLTQPIAADTTTAMKHLYGDFTAFPATSTVKVGEQIVAVAKKIDSTHLTTTSPICFAAAVGDVVRFVDPVNDRMSNHPDGKYPPCSKVFKYSNYFPAMLLDYGTPDPAGWNGGKRGIWFGKADEYGVLRRDYTQCVAMFREIYWSSSADMYATFGESMPLGGTFRRVNSDATLGDPITEIRLRCGEGAVLRKYTPPTDPLIEVRQQLAVAQSAIATCQRLLDEPIPIVR
jgi:hypothetical protein